MIPNDFGLIRQKDHNLYACFFPNLASIEEYRIEIVAPEYIDGYHIGQSTGTPIEDPLSAYAIVDCNDCEYVLAPCASVLTVTNIFIGFVSQETGSAINAPAVRLQAASSEQPLSGYMLFEVSARKYLVVHTLNGWRQPVIKFKRHRSDNVNPKGIIKDVNSDILQPGKKDELNGEADRIRDELPGNAESPDLDSESGSGADERADS